MPPWRAIWEAARSLPTVDGGGQFGGDSSERPTPPPQQLEPWTRQPRTAERSAWQPSGRSATARACPSGHEVVVCLRPSGVITKPPNVSGRRLAIASLILGDQSERRGFERGNPASSAPVCLPVCTKLVLRKPTDQAVGVGASLNLLGVRRAMPDGQCLPCLCVLVPRTTVITNLVGITCGERQRIPIHPSAMTVKARPAASLARLTAG